MTHKYSPNNPFKNIHIQMGRKFKTEREEAGKPLTLDEEKIYQRGHSDAWRWQALKIDILEQFIAGKITRLQFDYAIDHHQAIQYGEIEDDRDSNGSFRIPSHKELSKGENK